MTDKKKIQYIFICTSKDCCKNGAKGVAKSLKKKIKSEGKKSGVALVKTKCMNYCKKGPNVIFNNDVYHKINDTEALKLIDDLKASDS